MEITERIRKFATSRGVVYESLSGIERLELFAAMQEAERREKGIVPWPRWIRVDPQATAAWGYAVYVEWEVPLDLIREYARDVLAFADEMEKKGGFSKTES